MAKYGLVKADGSQRLAYFKVDRWNDNITRHTLYTCCGTSADAWGMVKGIRTGVTGVPVAELAKLGISNPWPATINNAPGGTPLDRIPSGSFDALVGAAANKHLYNWVPVPYPASAPITAAKLGAAPSPSPTATISLGQSISIGVAELTSEIQSTPGTFAMVGMSQGAAVISGVMKQLESGSLTSRYGDCIAAVAIGNPCRQGGRTFPGGTDPGGAGMFPEETGSSNLGWSRNGNLPSWWWELATPNDTFATVPTDISGGGDLIRSVAEAALSFTGGNNKISILENIFAALKSQGSLWTIVMELISSRGAALNAALNWAKMQTGLNPTPHVLYSNLCPPTLPSEDDPVIQALCPNGLGLGATTTYTELALAYINARGAAIPPR